MVVVRCLLIVDIVLHRFGRSLLVVVWMADNVLYRLIDVGIAYCSLNTVEW